MSIHFVKPGLQTSLQDLGRIGQMHKGISRSGAMDTVAMQMANWLVSKPLDSAVLEITLVGPTLAFEKAMTLGVCGAEFELFLNGNQVFNNESFNVKPGDKLQFDKLKTGARAYLAFSGELKLAKVLASYSTHITAGFGGYQGRQFKLNDSLELHQTQIKDARKLPKECEMFYSGNYLLRCVSSVESSLFKQQNKNQFYASSYKVSTDSNRMGIRLSDNPIQLDNKLEILSSGLTQGSIQIPPSGEPIISSVDGQTIGGYPRIANVITADLSLLGQLKANDKVNFVFTTNKQANIILTNKQKIMNKLLR
ncbi:biotin-dependent carboxyltransferase family protein [Aliikangiella coralliicola]|uniref:Biotin-dependent carboxyltransferase family protein n=1 Tax=Aliikangiella coralliicola TaxID=2592383 RepID=A0A545UK16_9GAMM|nr:biotin-dependent carboxyltransferase family protein [Aliikangiella coralliicola]TQV89807.1 biotin-dependent carboxyltransferase family protein [Aliikangiella coralliicola]